MGRELSHLDAKGRARMVDVSEKPVTQRVSVARGEVRMEPETLAKISAGALPKGDVLATADGNVAYSSLPAGNDQARTSRR